MAAEQERALKRRSTNPFRVVTHMVSHFVAEILGVRAVSIPTLALGFVTALVGFPLVAEAAKLLVQTGVAQLGVSPDQASAATAVTLAAGFVVLFVWTALLLSRDLRRDQVVSRQHLAARDQRALVMSCSQHAPAAWLRTLMDTPAELRIRTAGAPPDRFAKARWVQLLLQSLHYHGDFLEWLVLVGGEGTLDSEDRHAVLELIRRVLEDHPTRTTGPLQWLEFQSLTDPNDAESVRFHVSGAFSELAAMVDSTHRIGAQITAGTTAISVGMVLAASTHRVDVLYFRQGADEMSMAPVKVDTDQAKYRILDHGRFDG